MVVLTSKSGIDIERSFSHIELKFSLSLKDINKRVRLFFVRQRMCAEEKLVCTS